MTSAHVFVCYGSLSFDAAVRIARTLKDEAPGARAWFLVLFDADLGRIPAGAEVLPIGRPLHLLNEWQKPFVIARWLRRSLDQISAQSVAEIVAYLPHPFELPGNHFAFSDSRVVRRELLPDGFVNFMSSDIRPESCSRRLRFEIRIALRRMAAWCFGLRYVPYREGHLTQYERIDYARAWTDRVEGYVTSQSRPLLLPPRPGRQAPPSSGEAAWLVLDQELHSLLDAPLEAAVRSRMTQLLAAAGPVRIYYRAHPRGLHRAAELRAAGLDVVDATAPDTAEDFLCRVPVSRVLGFYSTPLLDPSLERLSVLPRPDTPGVKKPKLLRELRAALAASGAKLDPPCERSSIERAREESPSPQG